MSTDTPPSSPPLPEATSPPKTTPKTKEPPTKEPPTKEPITKPTTLSLEDDPRPTLQEFLTQIQELYNARYDSPLYDPKGALRKRRIRRRNQSTACIHLMSLAWFAMTFLFIAGYLMTHPPDGGCSGEWERMRCDHWRKVYITMMALGVTMVSFCVTGTVGLYYGCKKLVLVTATFYLLSSLILTGPCLMLSRHLINAIIDQSFEEYAQFPFYMLPGIGFFMILFAHGFMSMVRMCRTGFVEMRDTRLPTAQEDESKEMVSEELLSSKDDEITKLSLIV